MIGHGDLEYGQNPRQANFLDAIYGKYNEYYLKTQPLPLSCIHLLHIQPLTCFLTKKNLVTVNIYNDFDLKSDGREALYLFNLFAG